MHGDTDCVDFMNKKRSLLYAKIIKLFNGVCACVCVLRYLKIPIDTY